MWVQKLWWHEYTTPLISEMPLTIYIFLYLILVILKHEYAVPVKSHTRRNVLETCILEVICIHSKAVGVSVVAVFFVLFFLLLQRSCKLCIVNVAIIVFVIVSENIINKVDEILFPHWLAIISFFLETKVRWQR